jgi:hypothetical protein
VTAPAPGSSLRGGLALLTTPQIGSAIKKSCDSLLQQTKKHRQNKGQKEGKRKANKKTKQKKGEKAMIKKGVNIKKKTNLKRQ